MTQTYNISGSGGPFRSALRMIVAFAAVIGGLLLMAASAAVAFFLILGLVILVLFVVAILWGKAKLTGKPFGPKAHFKARGFDFEAAMEKTQKPNTAKPESKHGPIIDANETPDGWSVDG